MSDEPDEKPAGWRAQLSRGARSYVAASKRLGGAADERLRTAEWGPAIVDRFADMQRRITDAVRRGDEVDVDDATAASFTAAVGQVDWNAVADGIDSDSSATRIGARVRELTDGVNWSGLKPTARKLAIALVVAIATEAAGELIGTHASTLAGAIAGRSNLIEEAATALTSTSTATDVGSRLTTQFLNSEVLKSAAALASQSHLDRLGVSWA